MANTGVAQVLSNIPTIAGAKKIFDVPGQGVGSIAMFEAGHSYGYLGPAAPVAGTAIPNAAWRSAAKLVGLDPANAGNAAQLAMTFAKPAADTAVKMELSAAGALHGMVSQVAGGIAQFARVNLPSNLLQYCVDRNAAGDVLAIDVWERVTRVNLNAGVTLTRVRLVAENIIFFPRQNYDGVSDSDGPLPQDRAYNAGSQSVLGVTQRSGARTGYSSGAAPTLSIALQVGGYTWGNGTPIDGAGFANKFPSTALYRMHVANLSVEYAGLGLTTAQMFARWSNAQRTLFAAAFGAGGRYAADTGISDPAVALP